MKNKTLLCMIVVMSMNLVIDAGKKPGIGADVGINGIEIACETLNNNVNKLVERSQVIENGITKLGNGLIERGLKESSEEVKAIIVLTGTVVVAVGAAYKGMQYIEKWHSGQLQKEQTENRANVIKFENQAIMQLANATDEQKRELMRLRDFKNAQSDFTWCGRGYLLQHKLTIDRNGEPKQCSEEFLRFVSSSKNSTEFKKTAMKEHYYSISLE